MEGYHYIVGKNCDIAEDVALYNVEMGDNCIIEKGVILGYGALTKLRKGYERSAIVKIGNNTHIRTGTVIYAGCKLGNHVHIAHNTILREFTEVGDYSSIGSLVMCEGYTKIGHHTTIHSQCHITARMNIGNYVFFGPNVTTANDRKIRYYRPDITLEDKGPTVGNGAIIGAGAALMPYVEIGKGAFVAMGALVTKDVPEFMLVMGIPAKQVRHVNDEEVIEELKADYAIFIEKFYGDEY